MSRLKTSSSKSAKTSNAYDKTKRRKKKASSSSSSRRSSSAASPPPSQSPTNSSSGLTITAPSMRNSISSLSSPSSGTPTSSKECEQCGNPAVLEVGNNAKAVANSKKVSATANSGCQVCDFVAFRKAQRHCVQCDKIHCDVFCEWCGHGFHTKCAKTRGEQVDAVNGFCCKKCEAEQQDDDDDETAEANDVNAKCGECHRPFNSTADAAATASAKSKKDAVCDADSTGFKVNQSVLVENDEVLYNAVITDVDAKNERIKIHFLRWSKSFDNWYAMDDERINESLACDCCNRWFHIGCLPPIKSSGRFKDTTYVCPTCLDDAKGFFAGTRSTATSLKSGKATASAASATTSRRKGSNDDETPAVASASSASSASASASASKKRSSKPVVQSDSEEEELVLEPERLKSKATKKANDKENAKEQPASESRSRKRRRSDSVESNGSNGSDKKPKAAASPVKKSDAKAKSKRRLSPRNDDDDEDDETKAEAPEHDARDDQAPDAKDGSASSSDKAQSSDPADESKSVDAGATKPPEHVAPAPESEPALTMDKPTIKRKVSGHSVSSLLNSPSSPPRHASPGAAVRVKVEKDPLALPAPPVKKAAASRAKVWVTGRDAKTAKAAAAAAASSSSASSNCNSLSAFDILREVAAQSMSDEIDAPHPPPAARRTQKARAPPAAKGGVKHEADKVNGRTPPLPSSSAPGSSTTTAPLGVGIPMNSYVDLHFAIRKEMYLRICMLEDERLLERETAQLLRSMIYPTSDKFHDLKFVYVVNKELSSLQLTKRLLELVPITSGGTAPVIPMRPSLGSMQLPHPPPSLVAGSCNSSAAPSPARPSNASPAPPGYQTPVRSASPAIETNSNNAQPEPEPEPQVAPPHKMFQLPSSIGFASAVDRPRPSGSSTSSVLTSTISPSSSVGPPMPPPLSTKLLLETMHKHSKFPTLLPPPPPLPSSSLSTSASSSTSTAPTTTLLASSSSSSSSSSSTAPAPVTSVASLVTKPSPERPASLVNNISASISSN